MGKGKDIKNEIKNKEVLDAFRREIELNNLVYQNQIESDVIESGEVFKCPYFKNKLICTTPSLRETCGKECQCFDFLTKP